MGKEGISFEELLPLFLLLLLRGVFLGKFVTFLAIPRLFNWFGIVLW
jgi:hypothetical protein